MAVPGGRRTHRSWRQLLTVAVVACGLGCGLPAGTAHAADVIGSWRVSGSILLNTLDTVCRFKRKDGEIWATCDDGNGPGEWIQAKIADNIVAWKWKVGPEVLGFQGILMSDTKMKGRVASGGVFGKFIAAKQ